MVFVSLLFVCHFLLRKIYNFSVEYKLTEQTNNAVPRKPILCTSNLRAFIHLNYSLLGKASADG